MNLIAFPFHRPHLLPKVRSEQIMAAANGSPCTLRLCTFFPGYRCSGPETTIGAHLPVWGKGTSTKVTDAAVAFACSRCHDILDRVDRERFEYLAEKYPAALLERCLHGLTETHALLINSGVIVIPDATVI